MNSEKLLSSGKFAKLIGVSTSTLDNWAKDGTLSPYLVLPSGHKRYHISQAKLNVRKELDDGAEDFTR